MSNQKKVDENVLEVPPVSKTGTYNWTITLSELQGHCVLTWNTDAPFRAQQGQVHLYKNAFPSNPQEATIAWTWDDNKQQPFDTGQPWGSGWCAAWIAQQSTGPYTYVVKTPVTQ